MWIVKYYYLNLLSLVFKDKNKSSVKKKNSVNNEWCVNKSILEKQIKELSSDVWTLILSHQPPLISFILIHISSWYAKE